MNTKEMTSKIGMKLAVLTAFVATAMTATINTTNITDAINLIGTVGSAFIQALGTIFVDNLGTILTLVAVGIVIFVFAGFGKMIVSFMFSLFGNISEQMSAKYGRKKE